MLYTAALDSRLNFILLETLTQLIINIDSIISTVWIKPKELLDDKSSDINLPIQMAVYNLNVWSFGLEFWGTLELKISLKVMDIYHTSQHISHEIVECIYLKVYNGVIWWYKNLYLSLKVLIF